jgi:alpha-tubulin suppressor-like RCC1 family protein
VSLSPSTEATSVATAGAPRPGSGLALGGDHTCGINGGAVACWGNNDIGQLGDGTTTNSSKPVEVVGLANRIIAIAAGGSRLATSGQSGHSCAITVDGAALCWGANYDGQLGNRSDVSSSTPVGVVGLTTGVVGIAAGDFHTCALTTKGTVRCWGDNASGQLGSGLATGRSVPIEVVGLSSGVTAITGGEYHTCAITTDTAVWCWGFNRVRQLGDGSTIDRRTPVEVSGLRGAVAITAGLYHTCALTRSGSVLCWGGNEGGQLGDGTQNDSGTPVAVKGLDGVVAIAGGGVHTCALTFAGGVKCWGVNAYHQLGNGPTTFNSWVPVQVQGLVTGVDSIGAGDVHTCAHLGDRIECWGSNGSGELGNGRTEEAGTPVDVMGLFKP